MGPIVKAVTQATEFELEQDAYSLNPTIHGLWKVDLSSIHFVLAEGHYRNDHASTIMEPSPELLTVKVSRVFNRGTHCRDCPHHREWNERHPYGPAETLEPLRSCQILDGYTLPPTNCPGLAAE
jgi:hypothetical protein